MGDCADSILELSDEMLLRSCFCLHSFFRHNVSTDHFLCFFFLNFVKIWAFYWQRALVLVDLDQFVTPTKFSKNDLVNLGLGIWPNLIGKCTQPKFRWTPKPVIYFWPLWALQKTVFGCTRGQILDISVNCAIIAHAPTPLMCGLDSGHQDLSNEP